MFFGITMIAILLSVITNTFYKKRFEKEERDKRQQELSYLKNELNELLKRLSEIEQRQAKCIDLINHLR
jgi:hypothetical protein